MPGTSLAAALAGVLLVGCAADPPRIHASLPAAGPDLPTQRLIIAAVENRPVPFFARAGGAPRGYDAITGYGPAANATSRLRAVESDYGLHEVSAWPIDPLHLHCALLEVPSGADPAALLAALAKDSRVKVAEPLQTFSTRSSGYNDPYIDLQRGFQQMQVAEAHRWANGDGIKVALIDTGVDTEHPDLRGRIAVAYNFVDADAERFRRDRHGTEMAGVIAAVANNREGIVGVAPGARLVVLKACWQLQPDADAARCNSFTLARALVAAFDAHAQIVNLSLTGPEDPLLTELIREGVRRGVLFVGAAAHGDTDATRSLLQRAGVIEVTASRSIPFQGPALNAPGDDILTLLPGATYDFASGDSIATAQVTGIVALMLQRNPHLSIAQANELLRTSSRAPGNSAARLPQVNACAVLGALLGRDDCP